MLTIRLQRIGRKNDPSFRLVVTEKARRPKTTLFNEVIGTFNVKAGKFNAKADRIKYWMGVGAQVSPTVRNLLISEKILDGKKINVLPKKRPIKKEEAKAEATAA